MKPQHPNKVQTWESLSQSSVNDWHWQMKNAVHDTAEFNSILESFTQLTVTSSPVIHEIANGSFPFKLTPHMILALKRGLETGIPGTWEAFQAAFVPSEAEAARTDFNREGMDCIGEELSAFNPVPSITNFYSHRVLFRVTNMCPAYCRYCFRRRMVGDGLGAWDEESISEGLTYIAGNPEIREVILSGGDPLVLSDERLSILITSLKRIPHVKRLRIDSKALTMMPQRITSGFVEILRQHQPFYFIGHFSHLYELTEETIGACARLVDAGIPVGSHTPLLRGISDDESTLALLMEALVDARVQPYYLIHFIPTKWTEHFRVPLQKGIDLVRHIFKSCGGLATPTLIVYLPEGGGKVTVGPDSIVAKTREGYVFKSQDGRHILYPELS